jgi:acetoacetate decarboxylase
MRGRTFAVQYRLADPDEARRHVPPEVAMDEDPIVRARFWDLEHDALGALGGEPTWIGFREAVIAFPVRIDGVSGDYPTYMYADDFVYTAMGREVMGWPVRDGVITMDAEPSAGAGAGARMSARLVRQGRELMGIDMRLSGASTHLSDEEPPTWLATKVVPDATRPRAVVAQLVATGPQAIHERTVWAAEGTLHLGEGPGDELHHLAPREIVHAEYWSGVDLTIGWGTVLRELGRDPWSDR